MRLSRTLVLPPCIARGENHGAIVAAAAAVEELRRDGMGDEKLISL
jgi:hypothetical protein